MGTRSTVPTRDFVDQPGGDARTREEEGNAERGLVDQHRVGHLAVLAQRLAVVGQHRHHRVALVARRLDRVEHAADLLVGEGDLAVVGPARERALVGLGGIVGRVRVVEVQPGEEGPARPAR